MGKIDLHKMNLAISNIAWDHKDNEGMYSLMLQEGFHGLEIAPQKIFPEFPFVQKDKAINFTELLKAKYGIDIVSIQSIWFGKNENIFSSNEDRCHLIEFTKAVIIFAENINCPNIVFGCPKNRSYIPPLNIEIALSFFNEIGKFSEMHNTVIALEANPAIYNTNFINTTKEAFKFVKQVNCHGLKVNLDLGTVIYNKEDLPGLFENISLVNHIHISEPYLDIIKKRELHNELVELLLKKNYDKYVSIEMKDCQDIIAVQDAVRYIGSIFNVKH
jgi:sugar phosphate isomerase/epimerase